MYHLYLHILAKERALPRACDWLGAIQEIGGSGALCTVVRSMAESLISTIRHLSPQLLNVGWSTVVIGIVRLATFIYDLAQLHDEPIALAEEALGTLVADFIHALAVGQYLGRVIKPLLDEWYDKTAVMPWLQRILILQRDLLEQQTYRMQRWVSEWKVPLSQCVSILQLGTLPSRHTALTNHLTDFFIHKSIRIRM